MADQRTLLESIESHKTNNDYIKGAIEDNRTKMVQYRELINNPGDYDPERLRAGIETMELQNKMLAEAIERNKSRIANARIEIDSLEQAEADFAEAKRMSRTIKVERKDFEDDPFIKAKNDRKN